MAKYDTVEKCHTRKDTRLVLKYVNRLRTQLGLKTINHLAKGLEGDGEACSIAASLTTKYTRVYGVNSSIIHVARFSRLRGNVVGDNEVQIINEQPPKYVGEWIERFDSGMLPGLVKK